MSQNPFLERQKAGYWDNRACRGMNLAYIPVTGETSKRSIQCHDNI